MVKKIETVLVDLSGTLHIEDSAIPGAVEALDRLRDTKVKIKFVTNTTKEPQHFLHKKLTQIGFKIEKDEIFTSLIAARNLVSEKGLRPLLLLEKSAKDDFEGFIEDDPNAVVVGLAPNVFDYSTMNSAFRLLMEGAPLIAIHKGRYYRKTDGLYLGPGPFVAGLEYATGITAEVVGKPEAAFFHQVLQAADSQPSTAVMIGDDVKDDVAGAMKAGLLGILVKTGKYRAGDETTIVPSPTAVCTDFKEAVDYLIKNFLS